jgi:AraC-like DNA-binding protein
MRDGVLIVKRDLESWTAMAGRVSRRILELIKELEAEGLSRREIIRRLGTSTSQFYRLLDQTNYRKSVDQMVALLRVLDCDVDIVVRARGGA